MANKITDESAWYDVWGKLKRTVLQLDDAVLKLNNARSFALSRANLKTEYLQKMADVQSMRSKAIWLRDNIKSAMSYFGVELSGNTLSAAPALLLWPVVAAGVAWLASKTLDLWQFAQRVDEQKRLESTGLSPIDAAGLVKQTSESGSLTSALSSISTVLIIAAVGFGVWYYTRGKKS